MLLSVKKMEKREVGRFYIDESGLEGDGITDIGRDQKVYSCRTCAFISLTMPMRDTKNVVKNACMARLASRRVS